MRRCTPGLGLLLAALFASAGYGEPPGRVLSIEDAVQLALVNNLNLLNTMDSLQSARISENLAASRFNLKVTPSFAQGFGEQSVVDQRYGLDVSKLLPFGTTVSATVRSDVSTLGLENLTNSAVEFGVTQPLLRGFGKGTTEFNLQNAQRNRQASERNLALSRQRLAVDVVASYYNVVRQQGLAGVAQSSLLRSRELLRASEARLKVGLASKLDVFRAELQLSQAEEALILRVEALELALDSLKFKLGFGPAEHVAIEMVEPDYQPVNVDVAGLTELGLHNRIEVREQRDRIDDARRSLSVSRQNLLPQLDLNVRYLRRGVGPSFTESFNFIDSGANVFLSTSYALDRSNENASFAMAQIDIEARRRSVKLVEYSVANEVRAAARNVERIGKSIVLQERNIDFAQKQLRLATLRYQRGLANNFDIIDAESNLIRARSNYVSLLADHLVSKVELKRVTGTLDVEAEFAPGSFLPPARHHP